MVLKSLLLRGNFQENIQTKHLGLGDSYDFDFHAVETVLFDY